MKTFLARFACLIHFVLSGFGRLRFRGAATLLSNNRGVDAYLYQEKIRYVDFPDRCKQLTQTLVRETEKLAAAQGVPVKHPPLWGWSRRRRAPRPGVAADAGRQALEERSGDAWENGFVACAG